MLRQTPRKLLCAKVHIYPMQKLQTKLDNYGNKENRPHQEIFD